MKPYSGYKTIVCAVERTDIPHGYIEEAIRLATFFDGKLIFVTALPRLVGGYCDKHEVADLASEFPDAGIHQRLASIDCSIITETGAVGDLVRKVANTDIL